jgi:hypothetical protein
MDMFHHESEKVVIPFEDKVPKISFEEMFCSVEESSRWLDWDRGDRVIGFEMRYHGRERPSE